MWTAGQAQTALHYISSWATIESDIVFLSGYSCNRYPWMLLVHIWWQFGLQSVRLSKKLFFSNGPLRNNVQRWYWWKRENTTSEDRNSIHETCCIPREESQIWLFLFFFEHTHKKTLMQQVSACSLLLGGGYFGKCQKLLTEAESRQKRVKKKEVTLNYWTEQENSWKHCCRVSPPWTTDKESKDTGWFIMNRLWGHFLICDFRLDIYIHTHIYIKLTSLDLIEDNVKISVGELTLGPKKRADCLRLSTHCVPENERGPGGRWGRWSCPLQHTVLLQTDTHRKDIKVIFQSDNAPKG